MGAPIDPIRRATRLRRAARPEADPADEAQEAARAGLPVPVEPPRTIPPKVEPPAGAAHFEAHLLGQNGEKRGLRAGPHHISAAKASYSRVEWSGAKDRRAKKGRYKTEI